MSSGAFFPAEAAASSAGLRAAVGSACNPSSGHGAGGQSFRSGGSKRGLQKGGLSSNLRGAEQEEVGSFGKVHAPLAASGTLGPAGSTGGATALPRNHQPALPRNYQRQPSTGPASASLNRGQLRNGTHAGPRVGVNDVPQFPRGRTPESAAEPAGGLSADFSRRRSTRAVSKLHLGRQTNNLGRHSPQAEMAAKELLGFEWSESADGTKSSITKGRGKNYLRQLLDSLAPRLQGLEDWSYLLREMGNQGEWERAVGSFEWMMTQEGVRSDWGKLASTMISTLGRLGKVEMAQEVFNKAEAAGVGANVYTFSALLSAYGRSGRHREALEVFERMKSSGCRPNLITYNTVIDACGKGGVGLNRAWEVFEEMQKVGVQPDRITYNSLIAVCSRGGHWLEAKSLFGEMQEQGIMQDIFTFNTLIDALCKAGRMSDAAQTLQLMVEKNVSPNVVTYSTMIDGYGKSGKGPEAMELYRKMREANVRPDRVTYNTLLDIYGKAGMLAEALNICQEMERAGWKTDVVTYNALIDAYGKQGNFRQAGKLFEDMKAVGLKPNVLTYSALIDSYSKAGRHQEAQAAFEDFKRAGLKPDVVLYSALIDAFGKNGMVDEALTVLREMMREGIQPNIVTYNSLIDAYGRVGQVDRALKTLETMKGVGISPNCVTYNTVIDAYGKEGRAEEARQVFQRMQDDGATPDAITFSALIDASGKSGDTPGAVRIFREMQDAGVKPNVVTFSAILSACSRCGSCEEAEILLLEMRNSDDHVYGVAHGLLLGGAKNLWKAAEGLFDQIARMDRCTGTAFYNALTDVLWRFGQREGAGRVLQAARKRGVYEGAVWGTESEGFVDLHLMSVGAAQAMLHTWLLDLQALANSGRLLPGLLSILTGWGKHSKVAGDSIVKRTVEHALSEMGSPFHTARFNEGRIICQGPTAREWLSVPRTLEMLSLVDARPAAVAVVTEGAWGWDSSSLAPKTPQKQTAEDRWRKGGNPWGREDDVRISRLGLV